MSTDKQHIYVDTQYVYAYVSGSKGEDELYAKGEFIRVISNKNPNIRTKIPFVVLGETINNIKRKELEHYQKSFRTIKKA